MPRKTSRKKSRRSRTSRRRKRRTSRQHFRSGRQHFRATEDNMEDFGNVINVLNLCLEDPGSEPYEAAIPYTTGVEGIDHVEFDLVPDKQEMIIRGSTANHYDPGRTIFHLQTVEYGHGPLDPDATLTEWKRKLQAYRDNVERQRHVSAIVGSWDGVRKAPDSFF